MGVVSRWVGGMGAVGGWVGLEKLKDILFDCFRNAFDGRGTSIHPPHEPTEVKAHPPTHPPTQTGGDNFFDAGSCIDGRLTSAWNWCSQLSSKPFYPIFKLTGFSSFDAGVGESG